MAWVKRMIRPSTPIATTRARPVAAKSKPTRRSTRRRVDRECRGAGVQDVSGRGVGDDHQRGNTLNDPSMVEWLSPQYSRQRIR